jgi:ATP-binding cassette subfamily B protein
MKRLLAVWWSLLRLSWSTQRGLTSATLITITLSIAALPVTAFALRDAVDAMFAGERSAAQLAVIVAAVAYAALYVLQDGTTALRNAVTNRVAWLEIEPMVHRAIAELPGLDHLERTDVLDRLKVVRDGAGQVVGGMWRAVLIASSVLRMAVALALLGAVSPLLLPLLVLAGAPVWCQRRSQTVLKKAQIDSAEDTRLAQMLADLTADPGAALEIRVNGVGPIVVAEQVAAFEAAARTRARAVRGGGHSSWRRRCVWPAGPSSSPGSSPASSGSRGRPSPASGRSATWCWS